MKKHTKLLPLLLLLLFCMTQAYGAFEEVPISQTASDGEKVTFRCRHQSADTIRWRVDHMFITANPPPDITPSSIREERHVVHTLTIIGRREYNGTIIECVAMFDDLTPDEQAMPVVLHVVVGTIVGHFIDAPASLNLTYGETAKFHCRHPSADLIRWTVTPRWLDDYFVSTSRGGEYLLSAYLDDNFNYNATEIRCVAVLNNSIEQSTDPASLLLQGRLDAVDNLHHNRNPSTLSWSSPPSLDLTNADPDIVYCVEVYNITCGRRDLIISDCNVTEPSYTSDDIAPDGYIHEYTVTPRSNVPGARNGTSRALKDEYSLIDKSTLGILQDLETSLAIHLDHVSNQTVPFSYTLFLESLDGQTDNDLDMITAERNESAIFFDVSHIPPKRLFTCTILAYRCTDESSLLATFELSTHDVQNLSILATNRSSGEIVIKGNFVNKSEAEGLLVIVYNTHDPDSYPPQYHLISRRKRGSKKRKIHSKLHVTGLGAREVHVLVSAFVVEKSGLPFSRVATVPKVVFTSNLSSIVPRPHQPSALIEYSIQSTLDGVCITCDFKRKSSASDCLIVVHQRISQLNSSGLMNIEANWTRRFTHYDDTAYECITGLDLELYQIGVVGGKQVSVAVNSAPKYYIIALVVVVLLVPLLLVPTVLIITITMLHYRTRVSDHEAENVIRKLQNMVPNTSRSKNEYVDLPPTTQNNQQDSSNKVNNPLEDPTYTASVEVPSAECESTGLVQPKNVDDLTNGGNVEDEKLSVHLSKNYRRLDERHDSSGTVSQEQSPYQGDGYDDGHIGSPCTCKAVENIDQPIKTEDDLGASIESIAGDNQNLIQPAVKGFQILLQEHYLPEPKEPSHGGISHKVYQPVTTQPGGRDQKLDKEVVLPGCTIRMGQARTEVKHRSVNGESGIDTHTKLPSDNELDTKLKKTPSGNELVTGKINNKTA